MGEREIIGLGADAAAISAADGSDEYEEISSDEVDRVVEALEQLYDTVASENIQAALEEAINAIYFLVYDDEEDASSEAA